MTEIAEDDRYWSVDLPGLTKERAEKLLRLAAEEGVTGGFALDPELFLTVHLDRESVMALHQALMSSDHPNDGLVEVMTAWLGMDT